MVEVLDSGYHITIQDRGRSGFSKYGVPLSGCMDYISSNNAPIDLKTSLIDS